MACFVCRIVSNEAPANVVLETERTVAFLDIRQPNEGHVLVVPRAHIETIDLLDQPMSAELAWTTVRVARALRRVFRSPGMSLWQANGEAAGQDVAHIHIHLVPRHHEDELLRVYPNENPRTFAPDDPALERIAARVRAALS